MPVKFASHSYCVPGGMVVGGQVVAGPNSHPAAGSRAKVTPLPHSKTSAGQTVLLPPATSYSYWRPSRGAGRRSTGRRRRDRGRSRSRRGYCYRRADPATDPPLPSSSSPRYCWVGFSCNAVRMSEIGLCWRQKLGSLQSKERMYRKKSGTRCARKLRSRVRRGICVSNFLKGRGCSYVD